MLVSFQSVLCINRVYENEELLWFTTNKHLPDFVLPRDGRDTVDM